MKMQRACGHQTTWMMNYILYGSHPLEILAQIGQRLRLGD